MFGFRKLRGHSDFVSDDESVVRKQLPPSYGPTVASIERQARTLGEQCGFFRVPQILNVEEEGGAYSVTYEKIENLTSLAILQDGRSHFTQLVFQCGQALAVIHRQSDIPVDMQIHASAWASSREEEIFVHGDFTTLNVGVSDGQVYIWDWIPSRAWGFYANRGPASVDFSAFLFTLFMYGNSFLRSIISFRKWMITLFSGYRAGGGVFPGRAVLGRGLFLFSKKVAVDLWKSRSYVASVANFIGGMFCVFQVLLWKGCIDECKN